MDSPGQEIIRSPAARRMLEMATAGFYDKSRLALWMFEAIGREYDEMEGWPTTRRRR